MALKDRNTYALPALPALGPANYQFVDPIFGQRMVRLTDAHTMDDLGQTNFSFRTSAAGYQLMWGADSRQLYLQVSGGSFPILYDWNAVTMVGTRRLAPLNFFSDITFHDTDPRFIYGVSTTSGATNHHTLIRADVSVVPPVYSLLINLDDIVPGLAARGDTYTNTVAVAGGNLLVLCGGTGGDLHDWVVVFPLNNIVGGVKLLNTQTRVGMDHFYLHGANLDKSGRYVDLVPSTGSFAPYRTYIWDTVLDTVTAVVANSGGHECLGFTDRINQDVLTVYDNIQAIYTPSLLAPNANRRELINPVMTPTEAYIDMHLTWHNTRPGQLLPVSAETLRGGDGPQDSPPNLVAWRPWDNEIISIQTDGVASNVWRHCHHRSVYYRETGIEAPGADIFWYTPRANVSPDGNWLAFTSNWAKSLGNESGSTLRRQDVFIVERTLDPGVPPPPPPSPQLTGHRKHGRRRV